MKVQITYTPTVRESLNFAENSLKSFNSYNYEAELNEGFTRATNKLEGMYDYPLAKDGRLYQMKEGQDPVYLTKLACVLNNVKFWHKVRDNNEVMIFAEHDSICVSDISHFDSFEYMILNVDTAFIKNPKYNVEIKQFGQQKLYNTSNKHIQQMGDDWPLKYYHKNNWEGSLMVPGTAAYAISPQGADRLITAAETIGLDQSDYFINSSNIDIQYVLPSPVQLSDKILSTSWLTELTKPDKKKGILR